MMVVGQKENADGIQIIWSIACFFWKEHIPTLIWLYIEDMSEYSGEFSEAMRIFSEKRLESWNTRFESLLGAGEARERRTAIFDAKNIFLMGFTTYNGIEHFSEVRKQRCRRDYRLMIHHATQRVCQSGFSTKHPNMTKANTMEER